MRDQYKNGLLDKMIYEYTYLFTFRFIHLYCPVLACLWHGNMNEIDLIIKLIN